MNTFIALLRGINVGGKTVIPMRTFSNPALELISD
jgi:uncharacterized protein (DUF1697 family)